MRYIVPSSPPNMKTLKDRFVNLLPAFPPKDFSEEQAEEFLVKVLESYVESAKFYESQITNILVSYGRIKRGMTNKEKMYAIRELISQ